MRNDYEGMQYNYPALQNNHNLCTIIWFLLCISEVSLCLCSDVLLLS